MAKYNYDKSSLSGLGVGPFLKEVKVREAKIAEADATPSPSVFNSNILAKKLHPDFQELTIDKVIDHGSAKEYVFKGDVAYFRAGQYVSLMVDSYVRPYTLCCKPNTESYSLLIKRTEGGIVSNKILDTWKKGTKVILSTPVGQFYYTDLRDAKHVIACAGGSGITPFYSMAKAIEAGIEDFNLTILYGSNTAKDILLRDELDKIKSDKVKVVHVLADKDGFITADMIKKYANDEDYSLFVCGPNAMYKHLEKEVEKLGLPRRRVRFEVPGEVFSKRKDKEHKAVVHIRESVKEITINENTTIARNLENAGIYILTDCRSGHCGYCRSRLISGDVEVPEDDRRRAADKKFGWIHPCCTYAKSDIEIEIMPFA
ncbi:MAG: flavin reductase family protein [Coriobacteriia bacterium]|nr:flavin reductase family protein [Coriobacteriia bacterium]